MLVYIGLFIFLQFGIKGISTVRPDVLGISSNVDVKQLIDLTNQERSKSGLPSVQENQMLDAAAAAKAQNMFAENYWAHYSPSGKDPWGFIIGAGYHFSYAGENLARNFSTSQDVVNAWMNSPTHKENIVNSHYTDIGMAVAYGKLNGQDTVLVVQEFGRPVEFVAQGPTNLTAVAATPTVIPTVVPVAVIVQTPLPTLIPHVSATPVQVTANEAGQSGVISEQKTQPLINSFQLTKVTSISLLTFLALLLMVDLIVLRQRAVARVSARHWSHFALIAVAAGTIASSTAGSIL